MAFLKLEIRLLKKDPVRSGLNLYKPGRVPEEKFKISGLF